MTARSLISLQEAAERIGLDTTTIRRYVTSGRLTGYRLGPKLIRVDAAEVDDLAQPITPDEFAALAAQFNDGAY